MLRLLLILLASLLWSGAALAQDDAPPIPLQSPPWISGDAPDAEGEPGIGGPEEGAALGDEAPEPEEALAPQEPEQPAPPGVPQPVTLSAMINEGGAIIPSGLIWRVFDTRVDTTGQLALVAKSEDPTAALSLPPGQYVVHVAYGRAQASDTLTVEPGPNVKTMVLDAGALRLSAAVTGDIPIPNDLLRFDIFAGDSEEADREPVAAQVRGSDIVQLNAGVYHIVSYFGSVNAVVRADLRVEPGQLTEATLYHHAAQVSFRLVSEPGGEAIADIDWAVANAEGETVFAELGAFPTTVLAEGDYRVTAKRGEATFAQAFTVTPGQAEEIEVLTTR